jgi:integrase
MKTSELLHKYIAFIASRRSPATVRIRAAACDRFTRAYGDVPPQRVTHLMVYEVCRSDGILRMTGSSLRAAFRWAARPGIGLLRTNPLEGIELPPCRSRGRECVLTPEQHETILAATNNHYNADFRDFIIALENTGARPGEIAAATAADFSAADGAIVYHGRTRLMRNEHQHKTSGKDKERVILLTGEALEMVKKLARRHREGPLLRNRQNKGWTKIRWIKNFILLSDKLEMPHLMAYSYRHTFATRWLLAGGSVEVLAELLGNTPDTIHKHYAHLLADKVGLRAKLEAFRKPEWAKEGVICTQQG